MKVLIFDSTTIDKAPYIENYTKIFEEVGVEYDVCSWDKYYGNGAVSKKSGRLTIHKKWHLGKRKLFDFIAVSRILKRIIKDSGYTHLIIVNSIWAILLADVLSMFKGKYILDIRDYKCENVLGVKTMLKSIIDNSFFTTISSGGFREFLPESHKIIENHNISNWDCECKEVTLGRNKDSVNIIYMGHVRYFEENKKLINKIKSDSRFSLTYMGSYAVGCNLKDYVSNNIRFCGKFDNRDKPFLYKNYDIIHSLYGNGHISITSLLPNRLYDAVLFKKPILASKGTYLGEIVEEYKLGVVLDLDDNGFMKDLLRYVDSFDEQDFLNNATEFLSVVKMQQDIYLYNIKCFVVNDKGEINAKFY